jgi:hypothetical protein
MLTNSTTVGLQLSLVDVQMDEENEDVLEWMCVCENAYSINPKFTAIGGEQFTYTTSG